MLRLGHRIVYTVGLAIIAHGSLAAQIGGPPLNWSNPFTWFPGSVPSAGDNVTIASNKTILLDTNVQLNNLTINGILKMPNASSSYSLSADKILIKGRLEVGTSSTPHTGDVSINLTDSYGSDAEDKILAVESGGELRLYGTEKSHSWLHLDATAPAEQDYIDLEAAVDWEIGDEIVIASTDFDCAQAEVKTITDVENGGTRLVLDSCLQWTHFGESVGTAYGDHAGIDARAEVGLLSRNITIHGSPEVVEGNTIGGHTIARMGSGSPNVAPQVRLSWVALEDLGNENTLGQYPIHLHEIGDASDSYIRSCSITNSANRVIAIHSTQNAEISNNVAYDHIGHGYYFEDVESTGCTMTGNLGLMTRAGELTETDDTPGTFYQISPDNMVHDNVAAGSEGMGFYLDTPSASTDLPDFADNRSHSNGIHGLFQDTRPFPGLFTGVPAVFDEFETYKNRHHGIWLRSLGRVRLVDCRVADSQRGLYLAGLGTQLDCTSFFTFEGGLVLGESDNLGNPVETVEIAYGATLPNPSEPCDTLIGLEFYDGLNGLLGTVFAGFEDPIGESFARIEAPIHQLWQDNPWAVTPNNYVHQVTFEDCDRPIYLRDPVDSDGLASGMIFDVDGSITGYCQSVVFADNPFMVQTNSYYDAGWNAYVAIEGDYDPYGAMIIAYPAAPDEVLLVNDETLADIILEPVQEANFNTNLIVTDSGDCSGGQSAPTRSYTMSYATLPAPGDWPDEFEVTLRATKPSHSCILAVPVHLEMGEILEVQDATCGNAAADEASSLEDLDDGCGGRYYYDSMTETLYLKLETLDATPESCPCFFASPPTYPFEPVDLTCSAEPFDPDEFHGKQMTLSVVVTTP